MFKFRVGLGIDKGGVGTAGGSYGRWSYFMVGVHNFYKQEMDSPDTIVSSIQIDEAEEDSSPKD